MPVLPKISEAEWKVMEVIWQIHPIGGSDVARRLETRESWHIKTVKTLLNRLARKGVIGYQKEKNAHLYSPLIAREKYIDRDSKGFVDRVFGGNESTALMFFMESAQLSKHDISQLESLLKQKLRDNDD